MKAMRVLVPTLVLLIPAVSFLYVVRLTIGSVPTNLFELVVYALAILALLARPEWRRIHPKELWAWLLVAILCLIGFTISPEKREALGMIKGWVVPAGLVYWMMSRALRGSSPRLLLTGMRAQGLLIGVLAILQHLHTVSQWWGERWPDTVQYLSTGRSVALFNSPNAAAMILAPALLVAIHLTLLRQGYGGQAQTLSWKERGGNSRARFNGLGDLLMIAVIGLGLFATGSRGGVVAAFLSILVYWLWDKRKNLACILGAIGLIMINPLTLSLIASLNPDHLDVRVPIWHKTWDMLLAHPIFGLGLRSFHNSFAAYTLHQINYDEFISPYAVHPHNIFLYTWWLFGILGLFGLLFLLGKAFYHSYRQSSLLGRLGASLLLVFVIQGMVDNTLWKNDLIIWVVAVFVLVYIPTSKTEVE